MVEKSKKGALNSDLPVVGLHISCRNLANMDYFSKSDPFVVVYHGTPNGDWQKIKETEVLKDNINPDFVTPIELEFQFQEVQHLKFIVFDWDETANQEIGKVECQLGDIIGSRDASTKRFTLKDENQKEVGVIIVRGEILVQRRGTDWIHFLCKAEQLADKDAFSKSDPFFKILRHTGEGNNFDLVYTSEVIMDNLNPVWRSFRISVNQICNNDSYRKLLIQVYDDDEGGKFEFIGQVYTSLNELQTKPRLNLINVGQKSQGIFIIQDIQIKHDFDFLDYIERDLQFNFMVAIDFTQSNGEMGKEGCLHNIIPGQQNDYERTIMSVGSVIQQYDNDKRFPVWGFGARPVPGGKISHCFPLNENEQDPCVNGIEQLLECYRKQAAKVQFSGGTFFQDVLRAAFQRAQEKWPEDEQFYYILLILTDGIINDKQKVKDLIVENNNLPISIIIVGVGNEDFFQMEELDSDNLKIRHTNNTYAERDIVQFVDVKKFMNDQTALVKQILSEVPGQIETYMNNNEIKPLKKKGN